MDWFGPVSRWLSLLREGAGNSPAPASVGLVRSAGQAGGFGNNPGPAPVVAGRTGRQVAPPPVGGGRGITPDLILLDRVGPVSRWLSLLREGAGNSPAPASVGLVRSAGQAGGFGNNPGPAPVVAGRTGRQVAPPPVGGGRGITPDLILLDRVGPVSRWLSLLREGAGNSPAPASVGLVRSAGQAGGFGNNPGPAPVVAGRTGRQVAPPPVGGGRGITPDLILLDRVGAVSRRYLLREGAGNSLGLMPVVLVCPAWFAKWAGVG
ncbi:transposase-like protein [Thermobifida halotolerans]